MVGCRSWESTVEVKGAAALAVSSVVLESRGVPAAIWLLLDPWVQGITKVVTATPAVAALLTKLLLAESIGTPLGCNWLH